MLRPGDRLGDYAIVALVKSGGMASIYLATRTGAAGFARSVAIKVVHPHLALDPGFVQMFVDEARLSARVVHPNVVHVEELGQQDEAYFLVMEYVAGCSLVELLSALSQRDLRMRPELAVWIALQVADGLHAAHETRGEAGEALEIVHRDVSPQNVLLAFQGHVKLIDFGIAKSMGRSQQTRSGSLRGKLGYMSPEQAYGAQIDRRTDVYALGVLLWEMLAQDRLFAAADDLELLERVRRPHIEPPSRFAPGISPALDAAVLSALAPELPDRTPSAQAFRAALVAAVPDAASLDGSHLAALLAELLPDQLERAIARLPPREHDEALRAPAGRMGVLHTLTFAAHGDASPARTEPSLRRTRAVRAGVVVALFAAALLGVLAGAAFTARPRAQPAVAARVAPAPLAPVLPRVVTAPVATAHETTVAAVPDAAVAPVRSAPAVHHHHRHATRRRHGGPAIIDDMGL